jgi:hypothetical protein
MAPSQNHQLSDIFIKHQNSSSNFGGQRQSSFENQSISTSDESHFIMVGARQIRQGVKQLSLKDERKESIT